MDFYRRMALVCARIPPGRVASYGQLARLCGAPRNARQAGYALRMDLAGDAPAHRVVNGRGELSGAGHFASWDAQRALLLAEGVAAEWDGRVWRVDMARYQWTVSRAEAEDLGRAFEEEGI